jgi:hypothetical protein
MSITLKSLVNYSLNCYYNNIHNNEENPNDDLLNSRFFNYKFISSCDVIKKKFIDEMILVSCIEDNNIYFQFINCLLLIDDDKYLDDNIYVKNNKIKNIYNLMNTNDKSYNNFGLLFKKHGYNMIVIENEKVNIFEYELEKYIIIVKMVNDEFYPLYNINNKFYNSNTNIIKKILNNEFQDNKKIKIEENLNKMYIDNNENNDKVEYIDLETNNDYKLEISINECENNKNKNVFIINCEDGDEEENKKIINNDETIENLLKNIKKSGSLEIMQQIANKLNISIVDGKYKNGNLKYRKKDELYLDILEFKKKNV